MKADDDGEIFADISDWNTMCIQMLIKTFAFVPNQKGILFMDIMWWG